MNGSLDVVVNQGQGGAYILNPNGDTIGGTMTGGTFALYPTPYSNPVNPVVAEVINAVTYGAGGGQGYYPYYNYNSTSTQATTSPRSPTNINPEVDSRNVDNTVITNNSNTNISKRPTQAENPSAYDASGNYTGPDSGSVPETQYGYLNNSTTSSNVNSETGRGTSKGNSAPEAAQGKDTMNPVVKYSIWGLLMLILLFILRKLWRKIQE